MLKQLSSRLSMSIPTSLTSSVAYFFSSTIPLANFHVSCFTCTCACCSVTQQQHLLSRVKIVMHYVCRSRSITIFGAASHKNPIQEPTSANWVPVSTFSKNDTKCPIVIGPVLLDWELMGAELFCRWLTLLFSSTYHRIIIHWIRIRSVK